MFWVNGRMAETLPLDDRALHYGDGCFTTGRVLQGQIDALSAHLSRLAQGCQRLAIGGVDWPLLEQEMRQAARRIGDGTIKAIVTRGSGGRGYSAGGCGAARRIVSVGSYPAIYLRQRESGVRLSVSPIRLGSAPHLAGIKHLNRLEQVLIKMQIEQAGSDDAVVLDSDGMLVECCAANLFWRKGNQVFTPRLEHAGVAGLMRQRILSLLQESEYTLREVTEPVAALARADEAFICNSLMPLLSVAALDDIRYASRRLATWLLPRCLEPVA